MAVPHRVRNLSLGSASFPHSAQTHPVRRKRTSRALIRSPPADPPTPGPPPPGLPAGPAPGGPAPYGWPAADPSARGTIGTAGTDRITDSWAKGDGDILG